MKPIETLSAVLATNYVLYVKTQNFHWNVKGPTFMMLHKMMEEQYENLAEANDDLAERIRSLGSLAPGSMKDFIDMSIIKESPNDLPANDMIQILADDNQAMVDKLMEAIPAFAEIGDDGTADMLTARIQYHRQKVWMLKSHLV
jgi:starvation-inducible DNA-binding protein